MKAIDRIFQLSAKGIALWEDANQLCYRGPKNLLTPQLLEELKRQKNKLLPLLIERERNRGRCLVPIQPQGSQPPLFCIHPSGGNVLCYATLASHLGTEQPVYGLQPVGMDGKATPLTSIEEMAIHYIEELHSVQLEGTYQLLGWSLGGMVAFEMARILVKRNQNIALLVLIDSLYRPTEIMTQDRFNETTAIPLFVQQLQGRGGERLPNTLIHELPNIDKCKRWSYLLDQAKRHRVFSSGTKIEQVHRLWRVFWSNCQALANYIPRPYSGKIRLLYAENSGDCLSSLPPEWESLRFLDIDAYNIPGDHFSPLREPQVGILAERLRPWLSGMVEP